MWSDPSTLICASHHKSPINPENAKNSQLIKFFSRYFPIISIAFETHYIMINSRYIFSDKARSFMGVDNFLVEKIYISILTATISTSFIPMGAERP